MRLKWYFKIFALSSALCMTVFAIYLLNSGHSVDFWSSLGFQAGGQQLNWCPDRIVKIEGTTNSPWTVFEKEQKWMMQKDSTSYEITYLEMERWLARYCSVKIYLYKKPDLIDKKFQPFAKITFNDQSTALIYKSQPELYQINEVIFSSDEFQQGLVDLQSLVKF